MTNEGENMTKYSVTLVTVMSTVIEVEAEDREGAIELAFEEAPTPAWDWPDIGDWCLPSELFPGSSAPDDDVTEDS